MIRFVDLSESYWTDPIENGGPICAFLSTTTDRFIQNPATGEHTFIGLDEIRECKENGNGRLEKLLPCNFFSARKQAEEVPK